MDRVCRRGWRAPQSPEARSAGGAPSPGLGAMAMATPTHAWSGVVPARARPRHGARRGHAGPQKPTGGRAHDPARDRLVVFGGHNGGTITAPTWEFSGATWSLVVPPKSASPRQSYAAAYDPVAQRVVLHGGYDGSDRLSDTWSWDGADWTQIGPAPGELARAGRARRV